MCCFWACSITCDIHCLALDRVVKKVRGQAGVPDHAAGFVGDAREWKSNYHFWDKSIFEEEDFPRMYFIEREYANDPTNWFVPNRSAAEASLRSAGLEIVDHPEAETWVCVPAQCAAGGKVHRGYGIGGNIVSGRAEENQF